MINMDYQGMSIRRQCEILNINRSCYYYTPSEERKEEEELMNMIHEIWLKSPFYGYRKITAVLRRAGYLINHKKVHRLMQLMDLQAIYQAPKTSIQDKQHLIYPYLLNGLSIDKVNQVWASDLTYIKMPEGFVYLLAIIDLYSRFIVSASLLTTMEADLCVEILDEALGKYRPPEIFNTDQGAQFTSNIWINRLSVHNIKISMDGKGRCFDNIFIERFWRTIKYEEVHLKYYETVTEARNAIMDFITFYNDERPHQSLNYRTPSEIYLGENLCCIK